MATICLYGAASDNIDQSYVDQVFRLGQAMGRKGYKLVYGAGATGLMGAAARGVDSVGGYIIGVTPEFMDEIEPIYPCTELVETKTMAERKSIMEQRGDAFVIVPGGIGTFDEFFQVLTLKELGRLGDKPIVIFDVNGYYDTLINAVRDAFAQGFIRPGVIKSFDVCETIEDVISVLDKKLKQ